MKNNTTLAWIILSIAAFSGCNPDPWGCNEQEPYEVADAALADGTVGVAYDEELPIKGAKLELAEDSTLPPGLELKSGHVVGTPESADEFAFIVVAIHPATQCRGQSDEFEVRIDIAAAP